MDIATPGTGKPPESLAGPPDTQAVKMSNYDIMVQNHDIIYDVIYDIIMPSYHSAPGFLVPLISAQNT